MDILNLETDLNRLRIKDIGIKTILDAINQDRLSNNPILVSNKDLNKILTNTF